MYSPLPPFKNTATLLIRLLEIASINTIQMKKSTVAPPQDSFCNVILLAFKYFRNETHNFSTYYVCVMDGKHFIFCALRWRE